MTSNNLQQSEISHAADLFVFNINKFQRLFSVVAMYAPDLSQL